MAASDTSAPEHYNDWPNAVGFDTTYEEHEPVELAIQGRIPAYAAGKLFRTGIGPRSVTTKKGSHVLKTNHWFDAFAQVHRFQLHAPTSGTASGPNAVVDKVTYSSRLTCDRMIEQIQSTGKMDYFSFAAKYEPCRSFFKKVQSFFTKEPEPKPDEVINAVTLSVNYPGLDSTGDARPSPHDRTRVNTLCNKTDTARLQFLDPDTLKPVGLAMPTKLDPKLTGVLSGAHAETCPTTGDVYNYNLDFTAPNNTFHVFRASAVTGKTSVLATFNHTGTYIHSIFLTEHFVILCAWNSQFSRKGLPILWHRNILEAMYFDDKNPATWFVIDRRCPATEGGRGLVAKFESDPFFAFHTVNAFEVADATSGSDSVDLVCDVSVYKNMDVLHHFYMDNITSSNPRAHTTARALADGKYTNVQAQLRRYRLPSVPLSKSSSDIVPSKAMVDFTAPVSDSVELPTMNPTLHTKPYRYVYGVQIHDGTKSTFVDGLIKYDIDTKQSIKWERHAQTPGEPIFVPDPEAKSEDDGVLLTVVLDGASGRSYLLCLDARDLSELGRAEVKGAIGFGFHGLWTKL